MFRFSKLIPFLVALSLFGCPDKGSGGADDTGLDAGIGVEPDMNTWYTDADGDGSGDPATGVQSYDPPSGTAVSNGDDCDDTNPEINADATEICNGVDDDCDGDVDGDDSDIRALGIEC